MTCDMDERTTPGADQDDVFSPDTLFDGQLFDELGRPRSIQRTRRHPSSGRARRVDEQHSAYDDARDRIRELSAEHRALAASAMSEGVEAEFARRRTIAANRSKRRRDSSVGDQRDHHSRMRHTLTLVS